MRSSEICRRAARAMESGTTSVFSCCAIDRAANPRTWKEAKESDEYEQLFHPGDASRLGGAWGLKWSDDEDERRNCRVLALCFMAAIYESEGR